MALVVLLRGVNVGGHRTFRPSALADKLKHARRLPFAAEIVICDGREIVRLMSRDLFSGHVVRPDIVRFVSVLSRAPRSALSPPVRFPIAAIAKVVLE